ncbi:type 1 glutamine amidotransferase [Derxia gummosa]|uniref:Type 1 glutamine amidotransferase n=1 Tax=Derxia gummosa DSM 723 TaxID=1121388 RepID=A0A8B6X9C8_9BURK|nr:type 1 glutamine amidotransferase [Derxia gummosa]
MTAGRLLILQPARDDGPAFLATWLQARGEPFDVLSLEDGAAVPPTADGLRGLAILGGYMSVGDDIGYLRATEALVRDCVARGVPVIGHCLGGQLIASAFGARVAPHAVPEIGWFPLAIAEAPEARRWFGATTAALAYQWHYQSFALPPGAVPLAASPDCANQAFALGSALAMQFHIEIDAPKLDAWLRQSPGELAASATAPTVQAAEAQRATARAAMAPSQALAARIYSVWLRAPHRAMPAPPHA